MLRNFIYTFVVLSPELCLPPSYRAELDASVLNILSDIIQIQFFLSPARFAESRGSLGKSELTP